MGNHPETLGAAHSPPSLLGLLPKANSLWTHPVLGSENKQDPGAFFPICHPAFALRALPPQPFQKLMI